VKSYKEMVRTAKYELRNTNWNVTYSKGGIESVKSVKRFGPSFKRNLHVEAIGLLLGKCYV